MFWFEMLTLSPLLRGVFLMTAINMGLYFKL